MKSKELMIDDWVYIQHNGKASHYGKVTALLSSGTIETEINGSLALSSSVEPILLTPEILKKNGFSYCILDGGYYFYAEELYSNQTVEIILFHVDSEFNSSQLNICYTNDDDTILHLMDCNFVHELQHAFRVCKIDKEIVL